MASIRTYYTAAGERRYGVRWRSSDGKERFRAVPGPKRNALKVRAEIEARRVLGPLYEAPPEELGSFLVGWLERYETRVRASTYQRRVDALRVIVALDEEQRDPFGLAGIYLERLTPAIVEDAVATVARRAPRQAEIALATLKLALRNARERGQLLDDGLFRLEAPRHEEREPVFLTWAQVEELASWMPEQVGRIVPVAALTGARQGELFALRDRDVDLEQATMSVAAAAVAGKRRRTKTRASVRIVDLPPIAVTLLREQLLARPPTEFGLVFPAPRGGIWTKDRFMSRAFRPAARRAGLSLTFHDLRHTAASLMIAARWNVKEIAEQFGHNDGGALILRRYGHLYAGARRDAAQALDLYIRAEEARDQSRG